MTVAELKEALSDYPDDAHVVIAQLTKITDYPGSSKFEVHDVWMDGERVLNIISGASACRIDPNLKRENDLE